MTAEELPELVVPDAAAWRAWLRVHHGERRGVRLVLAKKGTVSPTSLTYQPALVEALCFGWIDGQVGRRDDDTFRQRFTPRRPRSPWSKRNVGIATRLVTEGRMEPSGLAEIERARADGRWAAAYDGAAAGVMPADLAAALDAEPAARVMWDVLTSQNRYAITYRLGAIKQASTRASRLEEYVAMLARGETIHPQKRSHPGASG